MTRRLSVRERGIEPLRTLASGEVDFSGLNPASCVMMRRSSPLVAGDVISFDHWGALKSGLVVGVLMEYSAHEGDLRLFFRVRPRIKSGDWSGLAIRVYPGQIERAAALSGCSE